MNPWEKTNPGKQYTTANHVELKKKHGHLLIILIFRCCLREEIQVLFILNVEKRSKNANLSLDDISESFKKNYFVTYFFHFTKLC